MKTPRPELLTKYAVMFVIESELEPTDENLETVLSVCARRPKKAWYQEIRNQVPEWRRLRATA